MTSSPVARRLKVFLCHSSKNRAVVLQLYHRLKQDGFDPWIDVKNLLPGVEWELAIKEAVHKTDVLIVCLSRALQRKAWVNKEIALALDEASQMPPGQTFLIPARLEDCGIDRRLADRQAVDLFQPDGYGLLLATLRARHNQILAIESQDTAATMPRADVASPTEVLHREPGRSGQALVQLAQHASDEGRPDEAKEHALRAVERLPRDPAILLKAASFAANTQDYYDAVSLATRSLAMIPDRNSPEFDEVRDIVADYEARLARSRRPVSPRMAWLLRAARRILRSTLNPSPWVYMGAAIVGLLPIATAYLANVHETVRIGRPDTFTGYFVTHWMGFPLFLPVAVFLTRYALKQLIPSFPNTPSTIDTLPPILKVIGLHPGAPTMHADDAKVTPPSTVQLRVYQNLLAKVTGARIIFAALAISTGINLIDVKEVMGTYVNHALGRAQTLPREPDWSVMFLSGETDALRNFVHVTLAYTAQWLLVFIAFVVLLIFFFHNQFFLTRIFQWRIHQWRDAEARITVDHHDDNKCFGFAPTYHAFNVQVSYLFFGGLILLTSRWGNIDPGDVARMYEVNPFAAVARDHDALLKMVRSVAFRDVGQWFIAMGWLMFLGVVSLPALIKFLPRVPKWLLRLLRLGAVARVEPYRVPYLREFFPLTTWKKMGTDDQDSARSVLFGDPNRNICGFKDQSFWPTGDNKAITFFFFAFTIFFAILLPMPPPKSLANVQQFFLFYLALAILGSLLTGVMLAFLKIRLKFIDWHL